MASDTSVPLSSYRSEAVARWSDIASRSGFVDFLSSENGFKTCARSGQPWANKDRPGIYFWLATDGEAYIGQSVTPQSRLRQHWRDHRDIAHACFMPCPVVDLDRAEEKLIRQLGGHFPLRNIKLAVATTREVPFDKLIDQADRERFLAGEDLLDCDWRDFKLLTRLQARKFTRFQAVDGACEALSAARTFITRAIPRPAATEVGFWSVTCFPQTCFIRVNAGQQEVFTCIGKQEGGEVRVLTDKRISIFGSYKARYRVPSHVNDLTAPELTDWLEGEALRSCRRLVVRLMRHTATLNSGSHCPQALRFNDASN